MKLQHPSWASTDPPFCSTPPSTFDQYITTLDGWKQKLIQGCEFVQDEEDARHLLQSTFALYFEINELGYFGWVIGTEMEILV
eukprot:5906868-Ditylum_brightwellii.AAC.1